ncbi:MAG: ABC transporter substrate-binding protein [Myxococcales bacterium]|nr:ABC transporter substrate-binding protein [Myxococcales bacterium]
MTSRRWQQTLVVVAATAAALVWAPPAMAQQPTGSDLPLVAFLAPLSGEWGGVGRRAHRSVVMASELWPGVRVEVYDTGDNPVLAYQAAVMDGAVAILGPVGEGESRAVIDAAGPDGLPIYLLSSVAGLESLGARIFRLHSSAGDQAHLIGSWHASQRSGQTYAVLATDDASGHDTATRFISAVRGQGGVVTQVVLYARDSFEALPTAEQLVGLRTRRLVAPGSGWAQPPQTRVSASAAGRMERPDAVFIADYDQPVADLLPALRYLEWISDDPDENVALLGVSQWNGPALAYAGDSAAGAMVTLLHSADDPRAAASAFAMEYEARWAARPTEFEAQVFDAAGFVLSALTGHDAAGLNPAAVMRAVDNADVFSGACGEMSLTMDGAVLRDMGLWQVDGGGRLFPIEILRPE